MQNQIVKRMVKAAQHCPKRTRQRLLLGIACALELGDEKRAKGLYQAALELGLFRYGIVPRGTRTALAGVWLVKTLALHPMPVKTVLERAHNCGFSASTMCRAASLLRVVSSKGVGWGVAVWSLRTSRAFWRSMLIEFTRVEEHAKKVKELSQGVQGVHSVKGGLKRTSSLVGLKTGV